MLRTCVDHVRINLVFRFQALQYPNPIEHVPGSQDAENQHLTCYGCLRRPGPRLNLPLRTHLLRERRALGCWKIRASPVASEHRQHTT